MKQSTKLPTPTQKVLIIEDEKQIRGAFAIILSGAGFKIDLAENGKIGINRLKSFKPDVILLDMIMPVMNGEEFLKQAKLKDNFPNLTTIILSNLSGSLPSVYKREYGVTNSFLKASLSPNELIKVVRNNTLR